MNILNNAKGDSRRVINDGKDGRPVQVEWTQYKADGGSVVLTLRQWEDGKVTTTLRCDGLGTESIEIEGNDFVVLYSKALAALIG